MNLRLIFNLMVCAALSGVLAPTDAAAARAPKHIPFSHRIPKYALNQSRRRGECISASVHQDLCRRTKGAGRLVWRG